METSGCNSGETAEKDGGQNTPKGTPPKEEIPCAYLSIRGLVHQYGAAKAPPLQFPEGFTSFISFCEVADEDACSHFPSLHDHLV